MEWRPSTSLTREELYETVWTTAVDRAAEDFGVSGVALAKLLPAKADSTPAAWLLGEKGSRPGSREAPSAAVRSSTGKAASAVSN
jgi:hypothetical protein